MRIRVADKQDARELLDLYAHYIEHTAITFEYDVPSLVEFQGRIQRILTGYPYLVALEDGKILGYAYAGRFHERRACDWAVETAIYVHKDTKRSGVGKALYQALEKALYLQNIVSVNACIANPLVEDEYLTKNSIQFHEHMGYRFSGEFYKCGYKFGRWYNLVWMEKFLMEHPKEPKPIVGFPKIREAFEAWLSQEYQVEKQ